MTAPQVVVYDCMIFLQAAARPDRVHSTLRFFQEGRVTLCISPEILAELRDVLTRPELQAKFPALHPQHVDLFLNEVVSRATLVQTVPHMFSLPRDKKDEPYVNLAIAAQARYLVTWNEKHLTYLMRRDTPEGREFCQRFPGLTIVNPPQFVRELLLPPTPEESPEHP